MPGTGDQFGDEKDRASWKIGDVILRNVAGKVCRFRCIDDDYQDGSGNYGKRALFLAECVIRSDVESTYEERVLLSFGEDNNYKKSRVRKWLGGRKPEILRRPGWMGFGAAGFRIRNAGTASFCCLLRRRTGTGRRSGTRKEREVLTAGDSGSAHRLMRQTSMEILYTETGNML